MKQLFDTLMEETKGVSFNMPDPQTAEEFAKLDAMSQFTLRLKWIHEEMLGFTNFHEKLKQFDKELNKISHCLFNKTTGEFENEFDSEYELKKHYELDDTMLTYLKKMARYDTVKAPKYDIFNKYRYHKREYILKGNNYVLITKNT